MSFAVRSAWQSDLDRLVDLAVVCQADPERACPSLSDDRSGLKAELQEIDGTDDWTAVTWVALDDKRELLGWIAAESDLGMGRVWWVGPFIADAAAPLTPAVVDALFATGRRSMQDFSEHELAIDARSGLLAQFAERNGFHSDEGSVALRCVDLSVDAPASPASIDLADPADVDAIALHDRIFPGTHSTGERLFGQTGERFDRFVARIDGAVVGYIATELQRDGALYIDYIGVSATCRDQGVGRALVATAVGARADEASYAHLTVRASNTAARHLYASLGFVDDLMLIPYRIGFTLDER